MNVFIEEEHRHNRRMLCLSMLTLVGIAFFSCGGGRCLRYILTALIWLLNWFFTALGF